MKQIKSIAITFSILLPIFLVVLYFSSERKESLQKNEVSTIGITYESSFLGNGGGTLFYFFKTPEGIFRGSTVLSHIKCPGYYYVVRYSKIDPSINELVEDSIIADSIGKKAILMNEIDPDNFINK